MPLKKKPVPVPWDLKEGDDNYLKEPWILKKGKEFITIETDNNNRGNFYLQKDDEKSLSLSALQAKLTYHQLLEFGYKLQKPKRKKPKKKAISDSAVSGASDPWTEFSVMLAANSALIVPGAASLGLVAPMIFLLTEIAFSPLRTCTIDGPDVM